MSGARRDRAERSIRSVLTLQTFADHDEVIELANGTDYGLGGVCYGEIDHATPSPIASEPGSSGLTVSVFAIWKRRLVGLNVRESAARVATGASSSLATLISVVPKTVSGELSQR